MGRTVEKESINLMHTCKLWLILQIYKDCCQKSAERPYLRHRLFKRIGNMEFCPYEDVLGVATDSGFTSLIIPGKLKLMFHHLYGC
jgi:hypothetical protein